MGNHMTDDTANSNNEAKRGLDSSDYDETTLNFEGLSSSSPRFHKHSGKIDAKLFYIGTPVILAASFLMGMIYAYLVVYIPIVGWLNFILASGVALGSAVTAYLMMLVCRTRNLKIAFIVGTLAGALALFMMWGWFECVWLNRYGKDCDIGILDCLFDPQGMWRTACVLSENGWYKVSGITPKGWLLWMCWVLEGVLVLATPPVLSVMLMRDSVFCEKCGKWTDELKDVLSFTHTDESELKEMVAKGDFAFLKNGGAPGNGDKIFYRFDCRECAKCDELFTLSLIRLTKTKKDDEDETVSEETLIQHLLINKSVLDLLRTVKKNWSAVA